MQCDHNYDNNAVDITSEMYACKTEAKYQNIQTLIMGNYQSLDCFGISLQLCMHTSPM